MNAANSFKKFKSCLTQRLNDKGFRNENGLLVFKVNDATIALDIQKDRKYSSSDEIRFTVNVGIFVDILTTFADDPLLTNPKSKLSFDKCHWQQRLGRLLEIPSDLWWSIRDEISADSICEDVVTLVCEMALPKILPIASSAALIDIWLEGNGPGLTEFERYMNLIRIFIAQDRKSEARAALNILETRSIGKSWQASAKYGIDKFRLVVN